MGARLLQISPTAPAGEKPLLSKSIRKQLYEMYERIPGVSCGCDRPGQCCALTPEEMASDFATMYPLYPVEYLNIVDYVRTHFDPDRQEAFLSVTQERPQQCPFLTDAGGCSIHPARPMVCRTYGVLSREQVERAAQKARGRLPASWISAFLFTERHTVCPGTRLAEPEKVDAHAEAMVTFFYERELARLGQEAGGLEDSRREILEATTDRKQIHRWTWGGFNVLMRSPLDWLRRHFSDYWKQVDLAE